ncbi:hypothetical protein C7974DRAFT_349378 [Boeremia exigua]|uniref:uncharacterized protein n=1 Tax=Boeremia exigua TaxID=749465 RepID=UPI001E8DCCF9|nr:uncharacterized protein C7974DRAFT_349378 [Boeremia exigua]KAH6644501.1 hypothetical protein C7974DRAFT_349378 [Boeremia exigua]
MAPVETDAAARSNNTPILLFGGQTLLVAGLTAHVLLTTRRAAKALPPSTRTRTQNDLRRRHARIFSAIAALSLASVTAFAVVWRVMSYVQWAELGQHKTPGSLWQGWYGTGDDGVGNWHLGDWIKDVDLLRESDAVAILRPEGFFYTAQHFMGLLASAVFIGVEGHRRNLSPWAIASFVVLGAYGSLAYSLSLFFVTVLYTPLTVHSADTPLDDALFTPRPVVYWGPVVASLLALNELPKLLAHGDVFRILRAGRVLVPLLLAFAPQITPVSLGVAHRSKAAAHRSYASVFHFIAIVSVVFYARVLYLNVRDSVPAPPNPVWDLFANAVGRDTSQTNRLLQAFGIFARKLRTISQHPALTITSLDVLFTTLSLLTWTFTRDLDVDALLNASILSFLAPAHHHRLFEPLIRRLDAATNLSDPANVIPTTTPRKRARASAADKAAIAEAASSPDPARSTRRSTRRSALAAFDNAVEEVTGSPASPAQPTTDAAPRVSPSPSLPDDDNDIDNDNADASYVPDAQTAEDLRQTEMDGAVSDEYAEAAESTGLALFLAFLGGVGGVGGAVLGAEVAS